ncbi:MAG: DUF1698 domain-containing protein, partial [Acidobacteria bacterium]
MSQFRRTITLLKETIDRAVTMKARPHTTCPRLPPPSPELIARAEASFSNTFPISPQCGLTPQEIEREIGRYFWHYPFEFGGRLIDADHVGFRGLRGRHYRRYLHIFPALLSLTGGTLVGYTVLDVGCNAGFWSIQARLAGAERVLGVDASQQNIDQARFIIRVTGLDGIDYATMSAYEISKRRIGEFDISLFLGVLYHLDKPLLALERLYEVTRKIVVIDTRVAWSRRARLALRADVVHDQNITEGLAFVPSPKAVVWMLHHVGF